MVLPASPWLLVVFLLLWMVLGAVVGVVVGLCTAALLKNGWSNILYDTFLAGLVLPGAIVGLGLLPWPRNTITSMVNGGLVTSTMNSFQHGEGVGWRSWSSCRSRTRFEFVLAGAGPCAHPNGCSQRRCQCSPC